MINTDIFEFLDQNVWVPTVLDAEGANKLSVPPYLSLPDD